MSMRPAVRGAAPAAGAGFREVPSLAQDVEKLAQCEKRIERARRAFADLGGALQEIRDGRLYLLTGHETFGAYVEGRWDLSRRHAYQLIEAARVVTSLEQAFPQADVFPQADGESVRNCAQKTPLPAAESHARALAAVPEHLRAAVWADVCQRTDGRPSARQIAASARACRAEHPERGPDGGERHRDLTGQPGPQGGGQAQQGQLSSEPGGRAGQGQPGATAAVTAPPQIPAPGVTGRPPQAWPEELKAENDELSAELAAVRQQLAGEEKLREENSRLKRKLADAREQNAALQQRVTDLEAQHQRRPASQTPPRTGVQEMIARPDGIPVIHHETGR